MTEPIRKTLYDVLKNGLKLAGRKTFLHRYIYMGEHYAIDELTLEEVMENIINEVNDDYYDEHLTGFLLFYPRYFVHVIDGSDESLIKHFTILYEKYHQFLGNVKVVAEYHHINQRFFDTWASRCGKPPTLLEKINKDSDFEETKRYAGLCVTKAYNLAIRLRQPNPEKDNFIEVGEIKITMSEFLPEYSLIDFLLHSKYIIDLAVHRKQFHHIPYVVYYTEGIQPVRSDYVPYDVFDDPVIIK